MENHDRTWGEPVKGCRISASLQLSSIPAGRPVQLTLAFRNDGSGSIRYTHFSRWFDYEFSVLYDDGRPVRLTRFGEKAKAAAEMGAVAFEDLGPGKEIVSSVEISRVYDLSLPGAYTIQASREVPNPAGEGFVRVTSNRVSFEVVEPRE